MKFTKGVEFLKADRKLGLIFGYAVVCEEDGEPYYDLQGDHIPPAAMLEASTEFMKSARLARTQHEQDDGAIVFAFPMTAEIAKALDVVVKRTGLLVAMKPEREETFEKAEAGMYAGFSIGGELIEGRKPE